jgi:hypothetical protein
MAERRHNTNPIRVNPIAGMVTLFIGLAAAGLAQAPAPARTGKASAPIDLTGYWVSIVTEDWRWRMVTPAKGDYASIPIRPEAKKLADAWDPAKDEAAGEQCKSYAAPALMRVPGRIRLSWQDDNTLKVEFDAGTQTRLLHFGDWAPAANSSATWQGDSVAAWEVPSTRVGAGSFTTESVAQGFGSMRVQTSNLRPGYLRKNGVPFSARTTMTEFWDLNKEQNGDQWLVITTLVDDPVYLQEQWVTALHFKKEPNGAKWDPTPCSSRW